MPSRAFAVGQRRGGRALAALVFSWAVLIIASCSGKPQLDAGGRYFAVHNVIGSLGLTPTGAVSRGALAHGQEQTIGVPLPAACVAVVALGGSGVSDLRLVLRDSDGRVVEEEQGHGPEAVVRACLERPGVYQASLLMSDGSGEFVLSTWIADPLTAASSAAHASPLGGSCQTPTAIALGRTYAGNTEGASDEQEGSCSSSGGHEHVFRLDIATRQRITASVSGDFDTVLYLRKDDCADENSELRCNDDAGPKRSRIDAVLDPAVYFLFVDGYAGEEGNYQLQVVAHPAMSIADICRSARALPSGAQVVGTVNDALDNARATCGRDAKGGDAPFRFDLATRSRVRFTERSTDFAPVVHVRRECSEASSEVACSDSGLAADGEATWAGTLDPGSYWVYADASDELAQGGYTLGAESSLEPAATTRSPGDACSDAMPLLSDAAVIEGDTFMARHDVAPSCASAAAPDLFYRVEVARRSRLLARLTGDESAHALVLLQGCGEGERELACGALVDQVLDPGTYFLAVDGARAGALGRFVFSYQLRDLAQLELACSKAPALVLGATLTGSTRGAGNKFASSCGAASAGQGAPDRVFRLALNKRTALRLSVQAEGFRPVLSLRKSCGDPAESELECRGGEASDRAELAAVLDPGTYYAVVDGWSTAEQGRFTLRADQGK
jgi:hypothetical protein